MQDWLDAVTIQPNNNQLKRSPQGKMKQLHAGNGLIFYPPLFLALFYEVVALFSYLSPSTSIFDQICPYLMCRNKQFFEVSSKMRNTIRLGVTGWLPARGTQANAGSQISGPVGEKIRPLLLLLPQNSANFSFECYRT